MEYIKHAFTYLKQRKLLSVFLLCILLLTTFFKSITDKIYIYLGNGYDRQSAELATMLDSVLGIPYRQQPHFRNDNPDIIKISQEELFTIPDPKASRIREIELEDGKHPLPIKDGWGNPLYATHRITVYKDEIHDVFNPLKLVESMPTVKEVNHANSLKVSPIFYQIRLTKPIYRQLCGNFLTCNSLNVSLREEFLQNPKMLQNIIKIAERPCDYIRTIDEIKPGDEIVYSTKRTPAGNYFYPTYYEKDSFELGIKWARERLDCDNKKSFTFPSIYHPSIHNRKFVLLVFNKEGIIRESDENEKSFNILIERKDVK